VTKPKIVKSTIPAPDTQSWYEYAWKARQETPDRLENTAKFLVTICSFTLTLFLAIGKTSFEQYQAFLPVQVALVFMILALIIAFFVMFPWPWRFYDASIQNLKRVHDKIVWYKYTLLACSTLFYLAALVTLSIAFIR